LTPAELPADAVEVGRVTGAWGVKGGIKVKPFAAAPEALFSSKRWFLLAPDVPGPKVAAGGFPLLLKVLHAREQGDAIVATAQDLADRDAAEALKGARVFVPRDSFPTPAEGEFYWVDLIGSLVLNRQGQALGTVAGLVETGPHCVLRVQPAAADAVEVLIPFVDAYVDAVDAAARRITVDWQADY
jgi:16S rRNA processing protein RimM